jgi:hypothetical protein
MRLLLFTFLFFSASLIFSQTTNSPDNTTAYISIVESFSKALNTYGEAGTFFNKPKKIVGNIYVFEDWNTKSNIVMNDKVYKLKKINLNMLTDKFEAKVGIDSMFAFNSSNIDYIVINNRKFKNYYEAGSGGNRNFELIYDGDELKLLKGYEVGVRYNEPDPLMIKKNVDNYFTTKTYYIKRGEDIKQIKLKKKNILNVFGSKASVVDKFVKSNKLSYKKEKDLNKMFIYYDSL